MDMFVVEWKESEIIYQQSATLESARRFADFLRAMSLEAKVRRKTLSFEEIEDFEIVD